MPKQPECPACGSDTYEGDLMDCPFCDEQKCEDCDMGDDVRCAGCENEEED